MAKFITTNIRLSPEMHKKLKYRAIDKGKSLSEVVREAISRYLGEESLTKEQEKALARSQSSVLQRLAGLGESGVNDLGTHHDKYLYPKAGE